MANFVLEPLWQSSDDSEAYEYRASFQGKYTVRECIDELKDLFRSGLVYVEAVNTLNFEDGKITREHIQDEDFEQLLERNVLTMEVEINSNFIVASIKCLHEAFTSKKWINKEQTEKRKKEVYQATVISMISERTGIKDITPETKLWDISFDDLDRAKLYFDIGEALNLTINYDDIWCKDWKNQTIQNIIDVVFNSYKIKIGDI